MKNKFTSIIISLALVVILILPMFSFAAVESGEGEATLLQEGEFELESASKSVQNATSVSSSQVAYDYIYNSLKNVSSSFNMTLYRLSAKDFSALYSDVINDNPDLFYVSSSFGYYVYQSSGIVTTVNPLYVMSENEIEEGKKIFDAGVALALSQVDNTMNDFQKAVVIHDYICTLAAYPALVGENGEDLDKNIYHSAYGFFYDRNIVCAGYSLIYSYIMNQLGIDCCYVASVDMKHAWNKIKIDGYWYNVDLTFDDFDFIAQRNTYGSVKHDCFLKSDSYFASESGSYHYDGKTYDTCDCTSTLYDDAFFNDVNTRIYAVDGYTYYLDPIYDSHQAKLMKRASDGTETQVSYTFTGATSVFTSNVKDSSGTQHEVSFNEILVKLLYMDSRFYVAASQMIYSVTPDEKRYIIKNPIEYYPCGIGENENGNLVYQVYGEETVYELNKKEYFDTYLNTPTSNTYHNYPDINLDGHINAKDFASIND